MTVCFKRFIFPSTIFKDILKLFYITYLSVTIT